MKLKDFFINIITKFKDQGTGKATQAIKALQTTAKSVIATLAALGAAIIAGARASMAAADATYKLQLNLGLAAETAQRYKQELELMNFSMQDAALLRNNFSVPIMSGQEVSRIRVFSQALDMLGQTFQNLSGKLLSELAPVLLDIMKQIQKAMIQTMPFITGVANLLLKIIRFINSFIGTIFKAISALSKFKEIFNIVKVAVVALANALFPVQAAMSKFKIILNVVKVAVVALKLAVVALAFKLFPVQAALLAIILIIDDIMTFSSGGESILGDMIDFFEGLGPRIEKAVVSAIDAVKDLALTFADSMADMVKSAAKIIDKFLGISKIVDEIKTSWDAVVLSFTHGGLIESIKSIGKFITDLILAPFKAIWNLSKNLISLGKGDINERPNDQMNKIINDTPKQKNNTSNETINNTDSRQYKLHIYSAGDPKEVAKEVEKKISDVKMSNVGRAPE